MRIKYILFFVSLWSCNITLAVATDAFSKLSADYKVTTPAVEIPNMPRVRSQDSLGICFGFSSATVAQFYICREKKIDRCDQLDPKDEISPLSAVAWANTNDPNGGVPEPRNHSNIQFEGAGGAALRDAADSFMFYADKCYPFDQFANTYGNNQVAVDEMIKRLEDLYSKNHDKTESDFCENCIAEELKKGLNVSTAADTLKKALASPTFGMFLYKVFFHKCQDIVDYQPSPKFQYFPHKDQEKKAKKEDFIEQAKNQISQHRPVVLDGICIESESGKCKTRHSVVLSGYRKVCKSTGDCRMMFKVQNSWGQDWQKRFDGGWVDANSLMESVPQAGALGWYL